MNGLELSKAYFEEYGLPMLRDQFPQVIPFLAAGLFGSGSECFGYDDATSQDHDYEPGFCLFLPDEGIVDRRTAFLLERAYAKLPKEYMGVSRSLLSPVGGPRHGVIRTGDFFQEKIGASDGILSTHQWLSVPEQALAECVNGMIFLDPYGEVSRIRKAISFFPEDVRKKKLAGHLLLMAQSGQYNYQRCLRHGEPAAAQLAVIEFVQSSISVLFYLNHAYRPYYKWCFRALRGLPRLSLLAELFEYLLTTDNSGQMASDKSEIIEGIAKDVIDELHAQNLTEAVCLDLEKHAYSVNDSIEDADLRNSHVLAAV